MSRKKLPRKGCPTIKHELIQDLDEFNFDIHRIPRLLRETVEKMRTQLRLFEAGQHIKAKAKAATLSTEQINKVLTSDQLVLSAFNSCIDMDKLKTLPAQVRDRFKVLLEKNRVKAVCFFASDGLGMRIYQDKLTNIEFDGSDEMDLNRMAQYSEGKVDACGAWLRCPGTIYENLFTKETEVKKEWVIAKLGIISQRPIYLIPFDEDDEDEVVDANDISGFNDCGPNDQINWSVNIRLAWVFTNPDVASQAFAKLTNLGLDVTLIRKPEETKAPTTRALLDEDGADEEENAEDED